MLGTASAGVEPFIASVLLCFVASTAPLHPPARRGGLLAVCQCCSNLGQQIMYTQHVTCGRWSWCYALMGNMIMLMMS
jgi:hypothetical protein